VDEGVASANKTPSVYLDTTVPSYVTARRVIASPVGRNQLITYLLWHVHRARFRFFVSPNVVEEASRGDPEEAAKRKTILLPLTSLEFSGKAQELSVRIMQEAGLRHVAKGDCDHVAIAATNDVNYLATWNCTHLANPRIIPKVARACEREGFRCPEIRTPREILERVVYDERRRLKGAVA
jgi:hypothetical protein